MQERIDRGEGERVREEDVAEKGTDCRDEHGSKNIRVAEMKG